MSANKVDLSKLTPQQLKDIAKTYVKELDSKDAIPSSLDDVEGFITAFNIKEGNAYIPAELIYFEYVKWRGTNKHMTKQKFFIEFAKRFKRKMPSRGILHYLLDQGKFDLTGSYYLKMKTAMKDYHHEQKRQKEKAKKKAIRQSKAKQNTEG